MIRRPLFAGLAATAVLALTSCSAVDTSAATVNGTEVSADELKELSTAYQRFLSDTGSSVASLPDDVVQGDAARTMLTNEIRLTLLEQELADLGTGIDQAAIDAQVAEFADQYQDQWETLPPALQQLSARQAVAVDAFQRAFAPSEADAKALYEQGPEASGVVCASHILTATEEDAQAALDRIRSGESFADVAAEVSTDTASGAAGGALADPNTNAACSDLQTFGMTYDPDFVAGVLGAEVGQPTEPVQTQFGYHLILLRPFEDVADDVLATLGGAEAAARQRELFTAADVSVASSVGEWDPSSGQVVAPGTAVGEE